MLGSCHICSSCVKIATICWLCWNNLSISLCLDWSCQVDKIEESFDFVNSRAKPLAAYLFTKNKKLQDEFVSSVSAGGMLVNDAVLHVSPAH